MVEENDILTLGLEEAWELFVMLHQGQDETYEKARWGIKLHFDIYDHIENNIQRKIKSGKVFIQGKEYDSSDYYSELEVRKKRVKEWLLENYGDEELYSPREE